MTKNPKKLSLENLLGSVEWRREVSPIRAAILEHMDEAHQRAFLRPTHCELWKAQRGMDPAVAAAVLTETMDLLRAGAHEAYAELLELATKLGFRRDDSGAIISFRRISDDQSMYISAELTEATTHCEAVQDHYWNFVRGPSARLVSGYQVGTL